MVIFHWTAEATALRALNSGSLPARRWTHFLEAHERFARGTSWGLNAVRWKGDHPVCLVIDDDGLPNAKHHIAANRTHLLTQGQINPVFDPACWKLESTEVDEVFIEGKIKDLIPAVREIILTPEVSQMGRN